MSKRKRFSLYALVFLAVIVLVFWQPLNRYLFHPEGLSMARSEACVINQSGITLIVQLSVADGASSTTMLDDGDNACSAAPKKGLAAEVRVSIRDNQPPFCVADFRSGQTLALTAFEAPDKCQWQPAS